EIVSQIRSDEWETAALQKEQYDAARCYSERQTKEQSAIVHHHDAQHAEMAKDRARHHDESKASSQPGGWWDQDQNHCDQFSDARADPSPGLKPDFRENVNRFRRGGELEEQCLEQNYRSRDAANPRGDGRDFHSVCLLVACDAQSLHAIFAQISTVISASSPPHPDRERIEIRFCVTREAQLSCAASRLPEGLH